MDKKIALVLACCIATSCAACSDDSRWDIIDACVDGEKRCDGSDIQVCRDNQWLFESKCLGNTPLCDPQTFKCTDKPVVIECENSEKKCDDNAVWTCINGKWAKTTACTPQQTCNPTTFVCDDNANPDIACDKDGEKLALGAAYCGDDTTLYTCVEKDGAGVFEPTTCEGDTPVCGLTDGTAACVAASTVKCAKDGDEYDLGAAYCGDDTTLYTCIEKEGVGVFEPTTCEGDTPVCGMSDGTAACVAASTVKCAKDGDETEYDLGATYCGDDTTLYTCVEKDGAGVFEPTTCEGDTPVCGMNGETAACVAGSAVKCTKDGDENEYDLDSTYCGDDGKLYTCTEQEDGSGAFIASDCPAELPVCDLDEGNCRAYKTCSVDSTQIPHGGKTCVGDVVRLCDDGALEDDTDCAANDQVCDSATSSCIDKSPENCTVDSTTISNGATICIGNEKVACTNGTTTNEACTTTVENASPTCAMIESVATCGFACNDGYILSDDGSSCVEVAKFDAVLTIREAYDALVDSETCGSGATSNTVKHADVALTGVVTALRSMGFYVQDTTGGIFVSCKDKTCLKYADDTNVAIGDNVKVTSNGVGHYYCDLQVQALKDSSVSIEKLAPAQTVEPTTALIEDIAQDGAKNLNLGKLVVLSGLEAVSLDEHGNWKAKQGDAEINVTPTLIDKDILKTAMNVGKSYGITGIGVYAYNEVRLAPRMREDIVEECTEGTYLCNPETNEYQLCYWGQWMEAEPCSGFNFTAAGGSNVYATEFACNAANDGCIITACAEGYEPTEDGMGCVVTGTITNNCSLDINGNKPALDSAFCDTETSYKICSLTGNDEGGRACDPDTFCNPDTINSTFKCEPKATTCTDGKMQCSGANDIQTCTDGSWAAAVSCASTITHATTATCETTDDTAVCKVTDCAEGFVVSGDGLSCEAEVVPPTCTDGKMQCSGANDIQTCTDGSWAAAVSCASTITHATTATCETTGDTAVCKATACDGGFVVSEDGLSCEAEVVVPPTCTDGETQCSGANDIQTCVDGSWATAVSCASTIAHATTANCEASGDTAACKVTACDEGFVPNADNSKCEPTAAPTTSLIISEVASISNSNGHAVKFVELYNAAESAVPLANCQLVVYKKASSTPDLTLQLDNSIDAGKTYVYCGSYANEAETDADLRAKCSSTDAANLNNLSTKRVIELQCDGNTIDITGKKGTELPHGSNIIRKCGITAGVTDPNVGAQATDWRSSTATIEGLKTTLGSHEVVCSE